MGSPFYREVFSVDRRIENNIAPRLYTFGDD